MRIGVDLYAIQAPSCRGRGIGRYAESLLRALMAEAPGWEYVFYRRPDLGMDWDGGRDAEWVDVAADPERGPDGTLQQIVQRNPQRLDWLLVPNPVVERRGFAPPEPVPGGPRLAAVVHDLIPALFPRYYLDGDGLAGEYFRDLRRLQAYDLLFANSEATARDVRERLGVPDRRVVTIGAASDPDFFRPAAGAEEAEADARRLAALGVVEPFLYDLGNVDWRKNVLGLVEAYARLPEELRASHELVLTFGDNAWFRRRLAERVEELGLAGRVRSTGPVTDEDARALHRRAALFLSPSLYEGFGLPILEAMLCGAAVVVADNSSQPEVAGPAGILARTGDPDHWAATIADLLRSPSRLAALRAAALGQAACFSWEASARLLRDAIEAAPRRGPRRGRRFALVAHASAGVEGFDPDVAGLFDALRLASRPTVFAETGRAQALPALPTREGWHDKRLLTRIAAVLGDPPVIHLVDTLESLDGLIGDLEARPGAVVFGNGRIARWPDLAPGADDDAMRRVLRLATATACPPGWLHRGLARLAEGEPAARPPRLIPRFDADRRTVAAFCEALAAAS